MIDPTSITNYNLTDKELEEHILFWVLAAGKNGTTAARSLDRLLQCTHYKNFRPFKSIMCYLGPHGWNYLPYLLKECGMGCYNNKAKTIYQLINSGIDLRNCVVEDLEKIYGIGRKTSRCFILHSRKNAQCAGLDTHMLKHLRANDVENVPEQTPASKKQYERLEKEVLRLAKDAGMSPANYDLMVWNKYSVKPLTK